MKKTSILNVINLSHTFSDEKKKFQALKDINLEVKSGEFLILLGPSGSGKSNFDDDDEKQDQDDTSVNDESESPIKKVHVSVTRAVPTISTAVITKVVDDEDDEVDEEYSQSSEETIIVETVNEDEDEDEDEDEEEDRLEKSIEKAFGLNIEEVNEIDEKDEGDDDKDDQAEESDPDLDLILNTNLKSEDEQIIKPTNATVSLEDSKVSYSDARIQEIELSKIIPNPFQPRKAFDPEALQELADSILEHGVIQPLVVTQTLTGYELVVGERRYKASQLAGLKKVPAIIKQEMQDQTKLEVALIENIQREELNPIEEAMAYDQLLKTFHLSQVEIAKKVGKARPTITNTIRLLNLPVQIQRGVIEGKISEGHARAILGLPDVEKMLEMFKMILDLGLNVRQVESKVREVSTRKHADAGVRDPKIVAWESELRSSLNTQVKIQKQGKGGKITIEFFSDEELDELVQRMAEETKVERGTDYFTV